MIILCFGVNDMRIQLINPDIGILIGWIYIQKIITILRLYFYMFFYKYNIQIIFKLFIYVKTDIMMMKFIQIAKVIIL